MTRLIFDAARAGRMASTRLVMLPAAYSGPEDFVREGFANAVRARALDIDLAFAAFELEEVTDGRAAKRLHTELILPARDSGCAVWLGGISLGGYLALACAERCAADLAGVCLFAPYLGSHLVTGEIVRARGVEGWMPEPRAAGDDEEQRVWRFIKAVRAGPLAVHLGFGREDRFAPRHRLMAAALAPQDVDIVSGGHDWATWQRLWERFLDSRLALWRRTGLEGTSPPGAVR
jgi:pimeloyl-ACP methyl ester carboxylesterase